MHKQQKKSFYRIQRVLVILLPLLVLSLIALLITNSHLTRNRTADSDPSLNNTDLSADLTIPAPPAPDTASNDLASSHTEPPPDPSPEPETEPDVTTDPVTLLFTGDVLLSDYVLNNYKKSGIDGILSPELLSELKNADITIINNEFPFSRRGTQAADKQSVWWTAARHWITPILTSWVPAVICPAPAHSSLGRPVGKHLVFSQPPGSFRSSHGMHRMLLPASLRPMIPPGS